MVLSNNLLVGTQTAVRPTAVRSAAEVESMIVVTQPDIGSMVLNELRNASEVRLAVAYFNPDDEVLTALCSVPRLTLIISEEFTPTLQKNWV